MRLDVHVVVIAEAVPVVAQEARERGKGAVGEDQILEAVAASEEELRIVGLLTHAVNVEFHQTGGKLHGEEIILPSTLFDAIPEGSRDAGIPGVIKFQALVHEVLTVSGALEIDDRALVVVVRVGIGIVGQNAAFRKILAGVLTTFEADVEVIAGFQFDFGIVDGNGNALLLLAVANLVDLQDLVAFDSFDRRAVGADCSLLGSGRSDHVFLTESRAFGAIFEIKIDKRGGAVSQYKGS